jgi:long-chain fatty acid transport protein
MTRIGQTTAILCSVAAASLFPTAAHATDGYFQDGVSIRDKAMGGAAVADPVSPLSLAVNPAGIAEIDSSVELGISAFSPRRQYTGSGGPGFTPSGTVVSGSNWFPLPGAAASWKLDEDSAIGIALYGNGGMNTNYGGVANPACVSPPLPASYGTFCGGSAGVNLMQAFVAVGYAHKFGDALTIGVSPVFAFQLFKAHGLAAFTYDMSMNPLTVDPAGLTDNGNSTSTGFGVKVGILLKPATGIRIGAAYQTETWMSRFKKYDGLFEDGGKFNIPSNFTVGVSIDAGPNITFDADYKHINYSDVPAVSNPSTVQAQFGSKGGPGFGWKNVDVFKFGIEAGVSENVKLRAGASFNNNPINPGDVTLNILAPGVSTQHFTVGAGIATSDRSTLNFSFLYSPEASTTGIEITPAGPNPEHMIEIKMHQFEFGVGWVHKL